MSNIKRDDKGNILPWECPVCHQMTTNYPALSRRDNKTDICSACGTKEAFEDYFAYKESQASEE